MKRIFTAIFFTGAALAGAQANDAIDALRGLKSVTDAGVNFIEYSARVLDAKVRVDKALADAPKDKQRARVEQTMQYHLLAREFWRGKINPDAIVSHIPLAGKLMADEQVAACPAFATAVAKAQSDAENRPTTVGKHRLPALRGPAQPPAFYLAMALENEPAILWRCADWKLESDAKAR